MEGPTQIMSVHKLNTSQQIPSDGATQKWCSNLQSCELKWLVKSFRSIHNYVVVMCYFFPPEYLSKQHCDKRSIECNVTVSMDLYVPYNLRNVDMFVKNVCRDSKHFWTEGDEFRTSTLHIHSATETRELTPSTAVVLKRWPSKSSDASSEKSACMISLWQ